MNVPNQKLERIRTCGHFFGRVLNIERVSQVRCQAIDSPDSIIFYMETAGILFPDDTLIYPCHGPMATIGAEKYTNDYMRYGVI